MNLKALSRLSDLLYIVATEKLPANSDNLKKILSNLESLETYQARKKYAEKNLKHLSSGSARIVYQADDQVVIKLAKNDKGIEQNKAEADHKIKSKFLNPVLNHAKNYSWVTSPFLQKISEKDFEKMTKVDFDLFGKAIRYGLKNVSENSDKKKPQNFPEVMDSEIFQEMKKLGNKFRLMPGDLARISSWGTKNNKNPVLIDSGLTKKIFDEYYD